MKAFCNRERIIALICMLFGGWVYYEAGKFPASALDSVGSSLYPRFLAIVIAGAAALLFVTSRGESRPVQGKREFVSLGVMLAAIVGYLFLMPRLGFILSTIPFLMVLSCYFDQREWKVRLKVSLSYSILFTLGVYFFFANLLGVLLPVFNSLD